MATLNGQQCLFVDCFELDRFVAEVYDRPYNSLHTGEYSQDEVETVDTTEFWTEEGESDKAVAAWLALDLPTSYDTSRDYDGKSPTIQQIMEVMHTDGVLPDGYYVVRMWW